MLAGKIWNEVCRFTSAFNAAFASILCLVFVAYLACRHRHAMNIYAVVLIFIPTGIQLVAQFQRARKIVKSMEIQSGTTKDGVFDLLFYGAIINLFLLSYIAALLRHIDGFF